MAAKPDKLLDSSAGIRQHRSMHMRDSFTQTDNETHLAWMQLGRHHPVAASLAHALVILADKRNCVVVAHATLAKLLNCSERSVRRSIKILEEGNWIDRARVGAAGTVSAYFINSRVCWKDARNRRGIAVQTGNIVLSEPDQEDTSEKAPLRKIDKKFLASATPFVPGMVEEQLTLDNLLTWFDDETDANG